MGFFDFISGFYRGKNRQNAIVFTLVLLIVFGIMAILFFGVIYLLWGM